ncbi:MAG: competence/damage-inducible protein A [Candidatus Zixiibacteriota bacterium]
MIAEIITIGDELLYGQTVDTNSAYLGERLTSLGIEVKHKSTIRDEAKEIAAAIKLAMERSDLVITTGGLGPTPDDVSKKAICDYFGKELVLYEDILRKVESWYTQKGVEMPAIVRSQALLPQGTIPLSNDWGTAPGIFIEEKGKLFFALPGVPNEMERIFDNGIVPILEERIPGGRVIAFRTIRTAGISEARLHEKLSSILEETGDIGIAFLPTSSGVDLRLTIKSNNPTEAQRKLDQFEKRIREKAEKYIYGAGEEILEKAVGDLLRQKKLTVAVAESCTGGLLGKKFTNIPGSSDYFLGGVITYSDELKMKLLGVPKEVLEKEGAVSENCALSMAEGVKKLTGADYGISITGIAGPTGGAVDKPVGLVYIGIAGDKGSSARKYVFTKERDLNRELSAQTALNLLRLELTQS